MFYERGISKEILIKSKGLSMIPNVIPGDVISVNIGDKKVNIGDLVLFLYNDHLVLHRVIDILDGGASYVLKGDNNPNDNFEFIGIFQIIGKARKL